MTHLEGVPNVAVVVVVTGKQDSPTGREGDRGDPAEDVVVHERVELPVCSEVEQAAGRVVGSGRERVSVREKPGQRRKKRVLRQHDEDGR